MGAVALGEAGALRLRAFFGLPLPEAHRKALEPYLATCAAAAPALRWVPAANLHLTIRFLGHVEEAVAEGIAAAVDGLEPAGFDLELERRIGTFKRGRLARVVWVGLAAGEEEAGHLAVNVERLCREAGLEPETRAFNAHLTLARSRDGYGVALPELPDVTALPAWRADELVLYRSTLGRGGAVYEPVRSISLR